MRLIRDAFMRLRAADGFSHARSMAFISELVLVQGIIALVGLASLLHRGGFSDVIVRTLKEAAPGPAGEVLTKAVTQAHQAGHGHTLALTLGVIGALISGTTLMGQMERAMNRLYGIERDRPTIRKYASCVRHGAERRDPHRGRVRGDRLRQAGRRITRFGPRRADLGGGTLARGARPSRRRRRRHLPVGAEPSSASVELAGVRRHHLRRPVDRGHRPPGMVLQHQYDVR